MTAGMYKTFGEMWTCYLRYASGQTNRHTDTLVTILRTPTGDEVTRCNLT